MIRKDDIDIFSIPDVKGPAMHFNVIPYLGLYLALNLALNSPAWGLTLQEAVNQGNTTEIEIQIQHGLPANFNVKWR